MIATCLVLGIAGIAGTTMAGIGPAPNSGDDIPDGSEFVTSVGQNRECTRTNGDCLVNHCCGQNSNKGDCT